MSLTLTGVPAPQEQLRSIQQELFQKNRQLNEKDDEIAGLRDEIRRLEREKKTVEAGLANLRQILSPLHGALGMVFGEIETMGVESPTSTAPPTQTHSRVWEDWKSKLGGAAAKIIDILLLHGSLDQTQIRIHLGTNRMQTVYDAVSKLNKAGIINKRDGRISLKEL